MVVVVEVSTKTTGVALIRPRHAHFQMRASTPQYLKVEQWVYMCVSKLFFYQMLLERQMSNIRLYLKPNVSVK